MDLVPDQQVQQMLAVAALTKVKKEQVEKDDDAEEDDGVVEPKTEAEVDEEGGWWEDQGQDQGHWWSWGDSTEEVKEENWWDVKEEEEIVVDEEVPDPNDGNQDAVNAEQGYAAPSHVNHDQANHQGHDHQRSGKGFGSRTYDHDNANNQPDAEQSQPVNLTIEERRVPWRSKGSTGKGYGWSTYDRMKGYNKGKMKSKRYPPWAYRKRQMENGMASMKGKHDQYGGYYTDRGYTDPWGQDWECLVLN